MSQIQYPYPEVHIVDWIAGVEWERERIIKLLEKDCHRPLDPNWEHYRDSCNCYQIKLIKGENK